MGPQPERASGGRHDGERSPAGPTARLRSWCTQVGARHLGVDPRGLAALRIALGLLVVADLLVRSRDLVAHYTDAGVLPRTVLREVYGGLAPLAWAHGLSGAAWVQGALFLVAGLLAVALALGHRSRLATALTFLLLVSLQARNPALLNAGDSLLRRLLLWGVLLPLGARWSLDAVRGRPTDDGDDVVVGLATAGLLVQVVTVYVVNAVLKLRGEAWLSGEAIRLVFGLDHLTVGLGNALAGHPVLLEILGLSWLALLIAAPLLVVLTGWPRAVLVAFFVASHLGMAASMRLGLFPLISIAGLLPFLPPRFWDAVGERVEPKLPSRDAVRRPTGLRLRLPHWQVFRPGSRSRRLARRAATVAAALLLSFVLVWNAAGLGYVGTPDAVRSVADPTDRRWDMFAPEPRSNDGWFVAPATLSGGGTVDAWNGGSVSYARPTELATTFPSHRWFLQLLSLLQPGTEPMRAAFADYLCHRWHARHDSRLERVRLQFVRERVRLDGTERRVRVDLGTYPCPPG